MGDRRSRPRWCCWSSGPLSPIAQSREPTPFAIAVPWWVVYSYYCASDVRWGLTRFFFAALAAADFSPARNVGDVQQSDSASRQQRPNSTIAEATGELTCVLPWISSIAKITVYSQPPRARRRSRIVILNVLLTARIYARLKRSAFIRSD